ncbi:MAG: helix-turn-helix transcriptional regulator [Nitrospirae bacterium]|nr:helix-turn-helix transcriptional regulator [Nitrospirota bacterium]
MKLKDPQSKGQKVSCPVENTLKVIGGRWKVLILRELLKGTRRFGELQRELNGITQKMLTQQLRGMERDVVLHREVYPQIPPKVEYSLTPFGKSLKPILDAMHEWGRKHLSENTRAQKGNPPAVDAARGQGK